ncbi:MAG TPA: tetratricopeptide repeat protein [Ktedonobacteraceae bacterium]|nr:tetratricopeptide repeat protein [Ktedonobacteraceae bacterium]
MADIHTHLWIVAPYRQDRLETLHATLGQQANQSLDCHRQLRGPYSGTGELLRTLVPGIYQRWPNLVLAHAREILSIAPELQAVVPVPPATLTTLAIPKERTRFYGRVYTLRLVHGIVNFLREYSAALGSSIGTIFFDNVQAADSTDQELLAILLQRIQPQQMTICIGTTSAPLPEALQQILTTYTRRIEAQPSNVRDQLQEIIPAFWQEWIVRMGQGWHGSWEALKEISVWPEGEPPTAASWEQGLDWFVAHMDPTSCLRLGQVYIDSEGTSDHLLYQLAYQQTAEDIRQRWHDERAEKLESLDQWSLHLGAIPYHRERGANAATSGGQALQKAVNYCVDMGFYEMTRDFGERGRRLIAWEADPVGYWVFTSKLSIALAVFEHIDEAEDLLNEARAQSSDPYLHTQAAYMTAMNYTRHRGSKQRNHQLAKAWINVARAIAQRIVDPEEWAFQTAFHDNGLALIELHLGHPETALHLVEEAIKRLDRELTQEQHQLHRSVLLYNRGQVYARLKRWKEALADYNAVIALDPHFSEYYLERGNLYRQLQQYAEALEDYQQVLRLSPPYPEIYYNRAVLLVDMERIEEALTEYGSVLELDPDHLDTLLNRASLLYEQGDLEAARLDIEHGLQLAPGNAQFLCTLGLIAMAEDQPHEAYQALSSAIEQDPSLVAAWTNRAVLAFETGQVAAAIADLTHALTLEENAAVYYNRGIAYQCQERWFEASEDYTTALTLDREDEQDLLYRRGLCYFHLKNTERAQQDFQAHLALGPSPYEAELRQVASALFA